MQCTVVDIFTIAEFSLKGSFFCLFFGNISLNLNNSALLVLCRFLSFDLFFKSADTDQ